MNESGQVILSRSVLGQLDFALYDICCSLFCIACCEKDTKANQRAAVNLLTPTYTHFLLLSGNRPVVSGLQHVQIKCVTLQLLCRIT